MASRRSLNALAMPVPRRCRWTGTVPSWQEVQVAVESPRHTRYLQPMEHCLAALIVGRGEGRILTPLGAGLALTAGKLTGNEDGLLAVHAYPPDLRKPPTGLFAVADGVSRPKGGEIAADLLLRGIAHDLDALCQDGRTGVGGGRVIGLVESTATWLDGAIYQTGTKRRKAPCTTLTAVALEGRRWWMAHTGDSPGCLLRDVTRPPPGVSSTVVRYRTKGHTWLRRNAGYPLLEEEELAGRHTENASCIYSCVGHASMKLDLVPGALDACGGFAVLSSDGWLSGNAGTGDVVREVRRHPAEQWDSVAAAVLPVVRMMQVGGLISCQPERGAAQEGAVIADNVAAWFVRIPSPGQLRRLAAAARTTIAQYAPRGAGAAAWREVRPTLDRLHPERLVHLAHVLNRGIRGHALEPYLRVMRLV